MKLTLITAAVLIAFAGTAQAQGTSSQSGPSGTPPSRDAGPATGKGVDRKAKHAEEERIEASYKADKARCDAMKGNEKDVCEKEAKGKEKIAKAELDAKHDPSERNQRKVEEAKADAEYDVAKERCDGMKGDAKDACQKDAKAKHEQAKASMSKRASTGASGGPAAPK